MAGQTLRSSTWWCVKQPREQPVEGGDGAQGAGDDMRFCGDVAPEPGAAPVCDDEQESLADIEQDIAAMRAEKHALLRARLRAKCRR